MADGVQNFDNYEGNSEFSYMGRNFGNPLINTLMMMAVGNNYMPSNQNGQGYYDSFLQRQRTQEMFGLRNQSFANQPLFQMMGMQNSPMMPFLSAIAGSPDSMLGKVLSPFSGGNPMGASMQLFSGLTGANTMGNFGRMTSASSGEVSDVMTALNDQIYKHQDFEGPGGAKEEYNKKLQDFIIKTAEKPGGIKTLQQSGIDIAPDAVDPSGKLTEKALDNIKNLDFYSKQAKDQKAPEERQTAASVMNEDYSQLLHATDDNIAKGLKDRLAKQLEQHKAATDKEIKAAINSGDNSQIKALIDRYQTQGETGPSLGDTVENAITRNITAREVISGEMQSELDAFDQAKTKAKKIGTATDEDKKKGQELIANAELRMQTNLKEHLKNLGMSDKDFYDKDTGKLDRGKIRDVIKNAPKLTESERIFMEGKTAEESGGKFKGYNFENSRGFKVEDFTSAFVKGAELRMLGDNKNMTPAMAMTNFAKYGGGAMSAARSLIGNRSGDETMSFISDFVGKSNVDMGSEKGAGEIEQLLRKTKATAGVAGISIKAMLEIIKATKDLAANNPQLQSMNSSATTEMALKSAATAAAAAKQMTPNEYREAGGEQGILTRDIKEKQAYAQSPLAGFKAAVAAMAKGQSEDKFQEVKKILGSINSGTDLNEKGGMQKLAKALNVDATTLQSQANNKLLQQEAFGIKEIADMTNEAHEQDVLKSFYNFHGFRKFGKDPRKHFQEEFKKHVAAGGDIRSFRANIIKEMGSNKQAQEFYRSQKGTIERDLIESTRSPEDREKIQGMIKRRADLDAKLDKQFAGKNAPMAQQLLNAMMQGKDIGDKEQADAIAGIFATSDSDSPQIKKLMQGAAAAGANIANMSVSSTGDDDMLRHGFEGEVNKITAARKEAMEAAGDKAGAAKLKAVDAEGLKSLSSLKHLKGATSSNLKKKLAMLRDDKAKGLNIGAENEKILKGLETAEATGIIESDEAIKKAQKGDLKGAGAAVIQAKLDYDVADYRNQKKNAVTKHMGEQLEMDAKGAAGKEIRDAMRNYTKGGKVDYSAMLDDYSHAGKGGNTYFDKMSKEDLDKVRNSALGTRLTEAQDAVKNLNDASTANQNPAEDTIKAMNDLRDSIEKGGAIAESLQQLATSLAGSAGF